MLASHPGVITHGYPLSEARIDALNRAGLECMQIGIDNAEPDDVSENALHLLDERLQWLAARDLLKTR